VCWVWGKESRRVEREDAELDLGQDSQSLRSTKIILKI
jgi:hypothetical protein